MIKYLAVMAIGFIVGGFAGSTRIIWGVMALVIFGSLTIEEIVEHHRRIKANANRVFPRNFRVLQK